MKKRKKYRRPLLKPKGGYIVYGKPTKPMIRSFLAKIEKEDARIIDQIRYFQKEIRKNYKDSHATSGNASALDTWESKRRELWEIAGIFMRTFSVSYLRNYRERPRKSKGGKK